MTTDRRDLRSYLAELATVDGALVRVDREVDPAGELSAVVKALEPAGKPAVRFEHVAGSSMPVVSGLFGTRKRLADALGVAPDRLVEHVLELLEAPAPTPVRVDDAPVHEVVRTGSQVSLDELPIGVHSAGDRGRYLTSGVVVARHPDTGTLNTGMYRMMVTGRDTLTVNAAPDHDLGRIFADAARRGARVPVAIVVGHHPAYLVASQLKSSVSSDSHELAGALAGAPLEVVRGRTVDLDVPARAEIVLEGFVDPDDRLREGPFGEFSYYHGRAEAPVCQVTAVTSRSDAIFHDLHPTHAEHRCLWLYPGREARLLQTLRRTLPGVRAVRIPFSGGGLSAYVSIDKRREGDAKQALLAAFAGDHFLKHVYVVDADVDVSDDEAVLWAVNVRFQADEDLLSLARVKGIRMDPSAQHLGGDRGNDVLTAKLGLDATAPLSRPFPERADRPVEGFEDLDLARYVDADVLGPLRERARWAAETRE